MNELDDIITVAETQLERAKTWHTPNPQTTDILACLTGVIDALRTIAMSIRPPEQD